MLFLLRTHLRNVRVFTNYYYYTRWHCHTTILLQPLPLDFFCFTHSQHSQFQFTLFSNDLLAVVVVFLFLRLPNENCIHLVVVSNDFIPNIGSLSTVVYPKGNILQDLFHEKYEMSELYEKCTNFFVSADCAWHLNMPLLLFFFLRRFPFICNSVFFFVFRFTTFYLVQ